MQSSRHTELQINQSQQFHVCKTTHNSIHKKPPPQKSSQNVAHLRFTVLWYTNSISFHANDILFIINARICFYFDSTNPLFQNYKHKLIPIHDTILMLSINKQIRLIHISFLTGTYNILISLMRHSMNRWWNSGAFSCCRFW